LARLAHRKLAHMRRGTGHRKPNAKDVAAEVSRQDRRAHVLDLTVDGLSTRAIAKRLGVSHETVRKDVKRALTERSKRTKKRARALATERIGAIVAANMPEARSEGSTASKRRSGRLILSALALEARLNGLEAPKEVRVGDRDGKPLPAHDDLLGRLARLAAAALAGAGDPKPDP